jgi:hypothetical protein
MELTLGIAVASLVVALGCAFAPARASWRGWTASAAWAGLVASMGAAFGEVAFGGAVALAAAAFAAAAALPAELPAPWRARTFGVAAAAPVVLGVAAIVQAANTFFVTPEPDPNLVLYAGCWAALAAALISALAGASAAEVDPERAPTSTGIAIASLFGGAAIIGHARGGAGSGVFSIPITSDGAPLMWGLPESAGGAGIFGLRVEALAPGVDAALALGAVAALALAVAPVDLKKRSALAAGSAFAALGALGALLSAGMRPELPDAAAYAERASALGAARGVPDDLIAQGAFIMGETYSVLWVDILPALTAMLGALALSGALAYSLRRGASGGKEARPPGRVTPDTAQGVGDLLARDLSVRAAALAWLAWMLATLTSWGVFSSYGFASPAEWTALGACMLCAGLAWAHWATRGAARRALPGLIAATLVLTVAQAVGFGAPFGVSLFF